VKDYATASHISNLVEIFLVLLASSLSLIIDKILQEIFIQCSHADAAVMQCRCVSLM